MHTLHRHGDFVLEVEWRARKSAKWGSGIYIRSKLPAKGKPWPNRYQINFQPWQTHGSLYGIVAARRGHLRPAGEWNSEEVVCKGRRVQVVLNGAAIVDADLDEASTPKTIDGRDHPGIKRSSGHIGFLGHGHRVDFCNLRVKDLAKW